MTRKGKRPRAARREHERDLARLVRDRERLAALEPGGSPGRPLDVPSPAVIEPRVRSTPCLHCEGELALEDEEVVAQAGGLLRRLELRCRRCGAPRTIWFRVVRPLAS